MIRIDMRGPIFDGRADIALQEFCVAAKNEVAEVGAGMVVEDLQDVIRNPTPIYWTRVRAEANRIHDDRMIYGPWLEGTGSRNYPVTRFRGYASFRRTTQSIQRIAEPAAERVLHTRFLRRMQ
jgi:hypothetical protein